jgi:hypothetical protein
VLGATLRGLGGGADGGADGGEVEGCVTTMVGSSGLDECVG